MKHSGENLALLERQMSELQLAIKECSVDEQLKYERSQAEKKKRMLHEMELADREEELKHKEQQEQDKQKTRFDRKMKKLHEEMARKEKAPFFS